MIWPYTRPEMNSFLVDFNSFHENHKIHPETPSNWEPQMSWNQSPRHCINQVPMLVLRQTLLTEGEQHIKKLHPDQDINITKKLITNPKTTATKSRPWIPPAEALTKTTYRLHFKSRRPATPAPEDRTINSRTSIKNSKLHKFTYTIYTMGRPILIQLRQLHISSSSTRRKEHRPAFTP